MYFDTFDHFDQEESNPTSAYTKFTCKHCGALKDIQMGGSYYIVGPTLEDKARIVLRDHLDLCPKFKRSK